MRQKDRCTGGGHSDDGELKHELLPRCNSGLWGECERALDKVVEAMYFDQVLRTPPQGGSALANFLVVRQQERGLFVQAEDATAAPFISEADRVALAHWAALSATERQTWKHRRTVARTRLSGRSSTRSESVHEVSTSRIEELEHWDQVDAIRLKLRRGQICHVKLFEQEIYSLLSDGPLRAFLLEADKLGRPAPLRCSVISASEMEPGDFKSDKTSIAEVRTRAEAALRIEMERICAAHVASVLPAEMSEDNAVDAVWGFLVDEARKYFGRKSLQRSSDSPVNVLTGIENAPRSRAGSFVKTETTGQEDEAGKPCSHDLGSTPSPDPSKRNTTSGQDELSDIFLVLDFMIEQHGSELCPIPTLKRSSRNPAFEAWASKLDTLCIRPVDGCSRKAERARVRTLQRLSKTRSVEEKGWERWCTYGIAQNVAKQALLTQLLGEACVSAAGANEEYMSKVVKDARCKVLQEGRWFKARVTSVRQTNTGSSPTWRVGFELDDGEKGSQSLPSEEFKIVRAAGDELQEAEKSTEQVKLNWKEVDATEEDLKPWKAITGFYLRPLGASQLDHESVTGYVVAQRAGKGAFKVRAKDLGSAKICHPEKVRIFKDGATEQHATADIYLPHSAPPAQRGISNFYEISILCNAANRRAATEHGKGLQSFPGTLLSLFAMAKFLQEAKASGSGAVPAPSGVLLTPASWIAKDDLVVDRILPHLEFAALRFPRRAPDGSPWSRTVAKKEEKWQSRHASSYNSRLVMHYWETLGMHPAFAESVHDRMNYISMFSPIENFDHRQRDDVLLARLPQADTPDVHGYAHAKIPDYRLSKEEVKMYHRDAPRQRLARFRMFGVDGRSAYEVTQGSGKPHGCVYRNLPSARDTQRMIVHLFARQCPKMRMKALLEALDNARKGAPLGAEKFADLVQVMPPELPDLHEAEAALLSSDEDISKGNGGQKVRRRLVQADSDSEGSGSGYEFGAAPKSRGKGAAVAAAARAMEAGEAPLGHGSADAASAAIRGMMRSQSEMNDSDEVYRGRAKTAASMKREKRPSASTPQRGNAQRPASSSSSVESGSDFQSHWSGSESDSDGGSDSLVSESQSGSSSSEDTPRNGKSRRRPKRGRDAARSATGRRRVKAESVDDESSIGSDESSEEVSDCSDARLRAAGKRGGRGRVEPRRSGREVKPVCRGDFTDPSSSEPESLDGSGSEASGCGRGSAGKRRLGDRPRRSTENGSGWKRVRRTVSQTSRREESDHSGYG